MRLGLACWQDGSLWEKWRISSIVLCVCVRMYMWLVKRDRFDFAKGLSSTLFYLKPFVAPPATAPRFFRRRFNIVICRPVRIIRIIIRHLDCIVRAVCHRSRQPRRARRTQTQNARLVVIVLVALSVISPSLPHFFLSRHVFIPSF